MSWFEVDRGGLRQLLEGKDKAFVIRELVQNAWDEPGVTRCDITLEPIPKRPAARLVVEDDAPEGFYDLTHAYTFFAPTRKRASAKKRGRFNIGEKQVLALCQEAEIITTKGHVSFQRDGGRRTRKADHTKGSRFQAILPLSRTELESCEKAVLTFIPPKGITTTYNGKEIPYREPLKVVTATLATEYEDKEGVFRATERKTEIHVYEPLSGEKAMIYEMGLPIIETGDQWHYNVQQRVPLTIDRDNVKPKFLQDVRAEVANAMREQITGEIASDPWLRDAGRDKRIEPETTETIATKRWGERRTVADPNDPRSRERAVAAGYHIVSPRELSRDEWARMREAEAIPSSSSLFPSLVADFTKIPEEKWTGGQKKVARLVRMVAEVALRQEVEVQMIESLGASTAADYDRAFHRIRFNVSKLGSRWFRDGNLEEQLELIIHELGHEFGSHLTEAYYNGLARIGARLVLCPFAGEIRKTFK